MIRLEIRRTNSMLGTYLCEKENSQFDEPIGIGKSPQEAIDNYLRSFKILLGYTPEYKWKRKLT